MARIRSIKPEFWTSAQLLECSTNARLLFIGTWTFADDAGRHPWSAKQVKAEIFPADDFTEKRILSWLLELENHQLIVRYSSDGKEYFYISGWKHQRIDKPQPPKYPDPFVEHSVTIPGTFPPDTIRYDRIGKEGKEDTTTSSNNESKEPTGKYYFESGTVRLNEKDFRNWKEAFPNLDLKAELTAMTPWADELGPSKWFYAMAAALNKKNSAAKIKRDTALAVAAGSVREKTDFNDPEWRERHRLDGIL